EKLKNKYTTKDLSKKEDIDYKRKYEKETPVKYLDGKITKVQLSGGNEQSNFVYTNNLFMERIQEFQADLLLNEKTTNYDSLQEIDY
ncbi:two-component sensor histidine kinase, partial [Bacillus pseudomycoides]